MLARRDIAGAVRQFSRAAQDSSPALRSTGELWLGHLSWKVFADAQSASAHLDRAIVGARDTSAVLVERARLLAFQRRYQDATRNAAAAIWSAVDAEGRGIAVRALVDVATDGAFAAMETRGRIADSIDETRLREAIDTLRGALTKTKSA